MTVPFEQPPDLFEELAKRKQRGQVMVLATVVATEGSVPREPGARMLFLQDGETLGSVGGGLAEAEASQAALELFATGGTRRLILDLGTGLRGQEGAICGGRLEIFLERIDPARRVVIAGGGHVGYHLHRVLGALGFYTTLIDPRAEWTTNERFPGAEIVRRPFEAGVSDLGLGRGDAIVIVTPEHTHDIDVLRDALTTPAGYVGMIGSRRKVRHTFDVLYSEGASAEEVARVRAPIGLDIGAETPAEIAVAIAAEMVAFFRGRKDVIESAGCRRRLE